MRQKPDGRTTRPKNTERIQAVLNRKYREEHDSLIVYDRMKADGMTDREIIREALIACGQMMDKGWQPRREMNELVITDLLIGLVRELQDVARRLATLDFSAGVETHNAVESMQVQLGQLDRAAKNLLGTAIMADDEDDSEDW